jgi:hypothetical protein
MDLPRIVSASAPLVVLVAWFGAGQWTIAGSEPRAWLVLSGVLALSLLIPIPGSTPRFPRWSTRVQLIGWIAVLGLVMTS